MKNEKVIDLKQKIDRINSLNYGKAEIFSNDKKIHIVFQKMKGKYQFNSKAIMTGFMAQKISINVDIFVNERKWGFMSFDDLHNAKRWTLSKIPALSCYL